MNTTTFCFAVTTAQGTQITLAGYELGLLVQASAPRGMYIAPHRQFRISTATELELHGFLRTGALPMYAARWTLTDMGVQILDDLKLAFPDEYTRIHGTYYLHT